MLKEKMTIKVSYCTESWRVISQLKRTVDSSELHRWLYNKDIKSLIKTGVVYTNSKKSNEPIIIELI